MTQTATTDFALMEGTWPPTERFEIPGFVLRKTPEGGGRVNSASFTRQASGAEIAAAVAKMRDLGLTPAFLTTESWQDDALKAAGLQRDEQVLIMQGPLWQAHPQGRAAWPPEEGAIAVWEEGSIAAPRRAVMAQVVLPKMALLLEEKGTPLGALFAAVSGETLVVHGVEVRALARQQGVGRRLLEGAAHWGASQGATRMMLVVTAQNTPALALYARAGLKVTGDYRYWCA